ncbi:MAG: ATP-binding protein, partial [Treponema sp.]|nr:ATP-binding protein [Treponema sp.]
EIASAKYDIPSLINDTVQLNRLRYESSPIEFILKIDENTPHDLQGDELRIKQILNNILSNAFKYTNKGYVKLSVTFEPIDADNVMMIFIVTDSGQGMTGSQIEKLFDEYTRFNAEANRDTVGTGLGMSITKHLVEMMNGTISVKSEPSSGSVFTVRIPQKRMGTAVCGSEMEKKLLGLRLQSSVINKKTRFIREYMPYGSVLLVDDVESNLYVAKGLLSPYSLSIDTAINGFEVLDKIKNGNVYDIIFMDHMMPKMDGMEAVRIIRDMGYDSAIIALTANVLIGQEKMFMENGFDGFISKPIDSRELNQILNDFIRNKKPSEVVQAARAAQQSAASSRQQNVQPVSPIIPNLNVKKLKQFFIEDAKNAVTVLEYLLKNITSLDKEELELYIITVHGIKSALANIGEKELSGFALKLENAGNEKLYDVMKEGTPVLINILKSFINTNLSEILKNNDVNNEENEYDFSYLYVKLNEFKDACAKFDKQNVNAVLNDLKQKKWPSNIKNLLEELSLDITHSAFKKAIAAADRIPLK